MEQPAPLPAKRRRLTAVCARCAASPPTTESAPTQFSFIGNSPSASVTPTSSISSACAKLIGLKARLATGVDEGRMGKLPTPAIVRLSSGALYVYGGRGPSGLCRLVDPITHAATDLTLEDLTREANGRALLIARRIGGAGRQPEAVRAALVPADAMALPQAPRACARGVAVRTDFRADDAARFPGHRRQGPDASRLRDAVRHDRGPRRSSGCSTRRCNICAPTRCRTPPIGSTSSSDSACSRISCAFR